MKRLLLIFLLLAVAAPAFAQTGTIAGTVRDSDGEPLPGVNVVVAGTVIGSATDTGGAYVIHSVPTGEQEVVATAVGYRTASQTVFVPEGGTVTADFVLEETTIEQAEVIVTASRRAESSIRAPASFSILTPREIETRNLQTLDAALRYVPGVQMADNQVNVRGSSGFSYNVGSRVLLLVDGVPMLGPETGGIPFEALPMSQVERIEVLKGPGSALYGGGALGGVIHLITKDYPQAPETTIRAFGGFYEPVRYAEWRRTWSDADSPRPVGGGTITHARRWSDEGGTWVNLAYRHDAGYLQNGGVSAFLGHLKISQQLGRGTRLDILGGATIREADNFYYWNGLDDPLTPGRIDLFGSGITGTNDLHTRQISFLPTLRGIIGDNLVYTVRGRVFRAVFHPLDDEGKLREKSERTAGYRYGGEVQADWTPVPGRVVVAGLTADDNAVESKFLTGIDGRVVRGQPEGAAYLQWEEALSARWTAIAGLRFDAYAIDTTEVASKFSPKLSLSFTPSDRTSFRLAFGQGFRVPSLAERFTNNQDFLPILPNLRLRPEESTGFEVGARSLLSLPNGGSLRLDGALFWNEYERLVEPKFVVGQGGASSSGAGFQFVNLTRARIRGLETSADVAGLDGRITGRLAYTLLDARDLTEDRPLVFRSTHLFKAAVDVGLPYDLFAGADYQFSSKPERVDTDFARFVPDADLLVPIHVLDLRAGLRTSRFELVLLLNNALEYYYVERPAILAPPRHLIAHAVVRL